MALLPCRECGHNVSTEAAACPNCGAPPARTAVAHEESRQFKRGAMAQDDIEVVTGKNFDVTFSRTVAKTNPTHGLFQPYYDLSEVDFRTLRQSSPVLTTVGAPITGFSLSYLLPLTVEYFRNPVKNRQPFLTAPVWAGIAVLTFGVAVLVLGLFASRERFRLLRRIRDHFRNNPGKLEYRQ